MLETHLLQDVLEDFQFSSRLNPVLTSQRGHTSSKSTQRPKRSLQRWLSGSLLPPAGKSKIFYQQEVKSKIFHHRKVKNKIYCQRLVKTEHTVLESAVNGSIRMDN